MYRRAFFALFCVFVGVQSKLEFRNEKCNRDDKDCMLRLTNNFLRTSVKGDPSLNMENLDPMPQGYIEGKFLDIQYKLYNTTVIGFKECQVVKTKFDLENNTMNFKLICPSLSMYGTYIISGRLIVVPIEGNGAYRFDSKDYHVYVDTTTKIVQDHKGQRYMYFKNFKALGDLRGGMVANMTNLFNGENDELAATAIRFANEQWKPVVKTLQDPIVNGNVKKIIKNMNKFLKVTPLNDYINY